MRHKLILIIATILLVASNAKAMNWHRFYQTGPYDTLYCRNIGWSRGGFCIGRSRSSWESGGYLALGALRTVAEIQQQNRMLDIVERQLAPQQRVETVVYVPQPQQQIVIQPSPQIVPPVLNRSNEEIRARFQQQEAEKAKEKELVELRAEIERLKLELEKAKLEKELEQAKK